MIHKLLFTNRLENKDLAIGIVIAHNVQINQACPSLEAKLRFLLEDRQQKDLNETEELFRKESLELLKNGQYNSTNFYKPKTEELLSAAKLGDFDRVNTVTDTCNFISLKYMVPISVWDLDQAETSQYIFRLGKENESYLFNGSDQSVHLKNVVAGFKVARYSETPIICPIKDSKRTKVTTSTRNIAAAVYFPLQAGTKSFLREEVIWEFMTLLTGITDKDPEYDII